MITVEIPLVNLEKHHKFKQGKKTKSGIGLMLEIESQQCLSFLDWIHLTFWGTESKSNQERTFITSYMIKSKVLLLTKFL